MSKPVVGIIGGSGLAEHLTGRDGVKRVDVDTPFGPPSGSLLVGKWHDADVVILNRHGEGHTRCPSGVPYRANIFALKKLGVTHIIASGAVGSLREEIEPGHLVICDQVIDKTHQRVGTFFDEGMAAHVELADPFCEGLRKLLLSVAGEVETTVHPRGTYVVMEGPQFSTRAESHLHRAWGGDLIGMTCMPEAKLAREAEMCYALVALPTDYDCWKTPKTSADKNALLTEIIGNLNRASARAMELISAALRRVESFPDETCPCRRALELGIWSDKSKVDPRQVQRLEVLVGRYFTDQ